MKNNNSEAVSPVIGVILMVAITVILAAVIAAFVFGMAGQIEKPKTVAITQAQRDSTTVTFTNMGGPDIEQLESLSIAGDIAGSPILTMPVTTGASQTVTTTAAAGSKHITITGTFKDGVQQVLLDTYITRTIP
jgi:flagellin-like protein